MKTAVLSGLVLLLTACTQAGTIVAQKPIPTDVSRSSTLGVTVMSSKNIPKSELQTLETTLAERLTSVGRFREVSAQSVTLDDTRDLTLLVDVITLPKGSIWDYSLFGEGEVKFDVKLIQRANGQVIGAAVVNGEASRGILGSSARNRAVDEAVNKVVEFVAKP